MPPAAIPPDETERLKDLHAYGILDSPKEASFDRLTELACGVFGMPMAYISLIDRDRQWCKSSHGFTLDPLGRDSSLCSHTILRPDTLVCEDRARTPASRTIPWCSRTTGSASTRAPR